MYFVNGKKGSKLKLLNLHRSLAASSGTFSSRIFPSPKDFFCNRDNQPSVCCLFIYFIFSFLLSLPLLFFLIKKQAAVRHISDFSTIKCFFACAQKRVRGRTGSCCPQVIRAVESNLFFQHNSPFWSSNIKNNSHSDGSHILFIADGNPEPVEEIG